MRKSVWLIVVLMITGFAAGCSGDGDGSAAEQGKMKVMTSFYPLYDFARQIGGEHVEVSNMIPAGIDPHDWSPKSQDIVKLTKSQLFIYNGAGFDDWWVNDLLKSLGSGSRPNIVVASDHIDLIPAGGQGEQPHNHEMDRDTAELSDDYADDHSQTHDHANDHAHDHSQTHDHADDHDHSHEAASDDHHHNDEADLNSGEAEDSHDHAHDHSQTHDHSNDHADDHADDHAHEHDHGEYDPHIWLSPRNAIIMAENVKDGLIAADPEHLEDYEANFQQLKLDLEQLDADYRSALTAADRQTFVTSHQAFAYLARDYGLTQLAVMGLSTDAEPTSQTLKNISDMITEHHIRYILLEELASPKIAETLARDLSIDVLTLNPLEGLTKQQETDGEDYISLMRHNLESLELALQE